MAFQLTDLDGGWNTLRKLLNSSGAKVKVGIIGTKAGEQKKTKDGKPPPLTVAQVGAIHEFGLGDNPERSFIRGYVDAHRAELARMQATLLSRVAFDQLTTEQALNIMGVKIQGDIQEWFTNLNNGWEPLTPERIIKKGSAVPLIDTGQLRSSITYKVVKI